MFGLCSRAPVFLSWLGSSVQTRFWDTGKLTKQSEFFRKVSNQVNQHLDTLLHGFSSYAVPLAVMVASGLAFLFWNAQYATAEPQLLELQVAKAQPQSQVNQSIDHVLDWQLRQGNRAARFMTPSCRKSRSGSVSRFQEALTRPR